MSRRISSLGRAASGRVRRQAPGQAGRMTFCFPFNRATTGVVLDSHPARRYDSEAIGSGISFGPGPFGLVAARGDGSTSAYIRLRSLSDTDPPSIFSSTALFTFSCWAKFDSFAATRAIYGESVSTASWTAGSTLYISTAGKLNLEFFDGAYKTLTGAVVLTAGLWYHLAFTRGLSGRAVYVNGVLDTSNSDTGNVNTMGGSQLMCNPATNDSTAGNPMLGDVCGVVAYDQDMGAGFIKRLFQEPLSFLAQPRQFPQFYDPGQQGFPHSVAPAVG